LFNNIKIKNGDWAIVFAESVVRRKGGIRNRELRIWVVTFEGCSGCSSVDPGSSRWNLDVGGYTFGGTIEQVRGI
jgi:hypothetical protein